MPCGLLASRSRDNCSAPPINRTVFWAVPQPAEAVISGAFNFCFGLFRRQSRNLFAPSAGAHVVFPEFPAVSPLKITHEHSIICASGERKRVVPSQNGTFYVPFTNLLEVEMHPFLNLLWVEIERARS